MEDPVKKSLPARPNLDHLREQAKELLSRLRDGDAAAAQTFIDHLPAAKSMTPAQVRRRGFRLADAQSAIARQVRASRRGRASPVTSSSCAPGKANGSFASLEVDGNAMPVSMLGEARLLVDGDRFRMESPEASYEGIFTLDVDADPPQIDIEFVEGPDAGEWARGIYQLEGHAQICLGVVGASRPARFATSAGSGHALERLRRSSPARPANVEGGRQRHPGGRSSHRAAASRPIDEAAFALNMTPLLPRCRANGRRSPSSPTDNRSQRTSFRSVRGRSPATKRRSCSADK